MKIFYTIILSLLLISFNCQTNNQNEIRNSYLLLSNNEEKIERLLQVTIFRFIFNSQNNILWI